MHRAPLFVRHRRGESVEGRWPSGRSGRPGRWERIIVGVS